MLGVGGGSLLLDSATAFEYDPISLGPINSFDANSIILFLQQYSPDRVTIVGDYPEDLGNLLIADQPIGSGLSEENINKTQVINLTYYWGGYGDVVYVEEDYELALMASTYASLKNAPLIIQNSVLDNLNNLIGKDIVCVGNVGSVVSCNEQYDLESLQQRYVEMTSTDKILLLNHEDLEIFIDDPFYPMGEYMEKQYTRNSLAGPFLASAKHEVIISTPSVDYLQVDNFIEEKIDSLQLSPEYLTIVASPNAIEMSYPSENSDYYSSTDAYQYSNLDTDFFVDLAVGRIFGISVADTSSYVGRSLFYEDILDNEDKMLFARGSEESDLVKVYGRGAVLSSIGYDVQAVYDRITDPSDWENKFFITYNDHGSTSGVTGLSNTLLPDFDGTFIHVSACSTCSFRKAYSPESLFCANVLRHGGIGYIGTTDDSFSLGAEPIIAEIFSQGSTLGKAFLNQKRMRNNRFGDFNIDSQYMLLGDPTVKLKTIHTMPKPLLSYTEGTEGRDYELEVQAMKVDIPPEIYPYIDYYYFSTGPMFQPEYTLGFNLEFSSYFESDGTEQNYINDEWNIVSEQTDDKLTIFIRTPDPTCRDPTYFDSANDYEFTTFEFDLSYPELPKRRVFVTSGEWEGNLGGIAGADYKCQEAAVNANLSGVYKAWISDSEMSVSERVDQIDGKYLRLDDAVIACNWSDLTDGDIENYININEFGQEVGDGYVWTGTSKTGGLLSLPLCEEWKSKSMGGKSGRIESTTSWASLSGTAPCILNSRLYCFEQSLECYDSDGGSNPNEKGVILVSGSAEMDECVGEDSVREFFCDGEGIGEEIIDCGVGEICFEGECGAYGVMELISEPTGAEVFIDYKFRGTTPLRFSISPGIHEVIFREEGYLDYREELDIHENVLVYFNANMLNEDSVVRVFLTDGGFYGGVGGLDEADTICTSSANEVGLEGNWKAWLSNSSTSAESRLQHHQIPYVLLDSKVIADNWTDLTDGFLINPINVLVSGYPAQGSSSVLTGTSLEGYSDEDNCLDWSNSSDIEKGTIGYYSSISSCWTSCASARCDLSRRLYCFEEK